MKGKTAFDEITQSFLSIIFDNIDVGVMVYDSLGNVLFVNVVMINWRNIPRTEYLTMNVHDFTKVIDICVFDLVCQEKRRISRLQYYQDFRKTGGPTRVRIVTGTPIFNEKGDIQYVVTMLQDVDDFRNLYRSLLGTHEILPPMDNAAQNEKFSIVAKSPEISQLISICDNIAPLDSTVLLCGESGTGKEVFARYIHDHSSRKNKPMISVNCAAIPENLIEAELFGYEKGSFTGANREGKVGLVEAASGGTLFLDEINSLPLSIQSKVLRMIEEKAIQRVGSVKSKAVDFRLIAATNQDLWAQVKKGQFREDLYYRIYVIPLTIPPVRNRREDIVPFCLHFLEYFCKKYNLKKSFSEKVLDELQRYDWPGNVREIRNFVERMVVMTPPGITEIASIPSGMLSEAAEQTAVENEPASAGGISKNAVLEALAQCGGNRQRAAEYLGISRRYLQYKIKEYRIPSRCRYE